MTKTNSTQPADTTKAGERTLRHGDLFEFDGQAAYLLRHRADDRLPEEWVMEVVSDDPTADGNILGRGATAEECVAKAEGK